MRTDIAATGIVYFITHLRIRLYLAVIGLQLITNARQHTLAGLFAKSHGGALCACFRKTIKRDFFIRNPPHRAVCEFAFGKAARSDLPLRADAGV